MHPKVKGPRRGVRTTSPLDLDPKPNLFISERPSLEVTIKLREALESSFEQIHDRLLCSHILLCNIVSGDHFAILWRFNSLVCQLAFRDS